MALIECPECKNQVSDTAEACPHCGFSLKRPPQKSGCLKGIGILIAIPVAIFVALFLFFLTKEAVAPTDLSTSTSFAIDKGKENLEAQLKDPDSVTYGEVWAGRLKGSTGEGTLVACGYFNARNGFGGMVGQRRFVSGPVGPALTDENAGVLLETAWKQACLENRQP